MKVFLGLIIASISLNLLAAELTSRAYKKVTIGMSPEQALSILTEYQSGKGKYGVEDSCYYLSPKDEQAGVSIMVLNGKVARFDVWKQGDNTKTTKGIGIGSTREQVVAAYPNLTSGEHEYLGDAGENLIVTQADGYGIIFEIYQNLVTNFRLGKYPAVGFIEGCS